MEEEDIADAAAVATDLAGGPTGTAVEGTRRCDSGAVCQNDPLCGSAPYLQCVMLFGQGPAALPPEK